MKTKRVVIGVALGVAISSQGGVARAELFAEDCQQVKIPPHDALMKMKKYELGCKSAAFWDKTGDKEYKNPPDAVNRDDLPICMGFGKDINAAVEGKDHTEENPSYNCRRLAAKNWTIALNMYFVWCLAKNHLSEGKVLWTTPASKLDTTFKSQTSNSTWKDMVTVKEMCYFHALRGDTFLRSKKSQETLSKIDKISGTQSLLKIGKNIEKTVKNPQVKTLERKNAMKQLPVKKVVEKKVVEKKVVEKKVVEKKVVEKKVVEKKPVLKKVVEKKPVEKKVIEKKTTKQSIE